MTTSNQPDDEAAPNLEEETGLHIALISPHGRIRGHDLELGVEADTGGQTLYVVELARALARRPEVERVELFTRRIHDAVVGPDYAEPVEELCSGASIVRIEAGPEEYLRKEDLWDHLDSFADNMLACLHGRERVPDVIHAHYADAGYIGQRVAHLLGRPLVFTGHSLGRIKRRRLLASGQSQEDIEERYHISRRIEAEEDTLGAADLVVTSTAQEIEEQYAFYDHYRPSGMRVIPPGLDLDRFHARGSNGEAQHIERELARFLRDPELPIVLAVARPDERKNLSILVRAFGLSERLRAKANLVIVCGNREDLRDTSGAVREVITGLLLSIDAHDVYGHVAIPKRHRSEDIPIYYRLAARSQGVFVNPALTEPFGLTLLEAAASGLPIVATEDGGPTEILANCDNGALIDPLDAEGIAEAILGIIEEPARWQRLSRNGIEGVRAHYSWSAHAASYIAALQELPEGHLPEAAPRIITREHLYNDRAVFTDIDQNLLGDAGAIARFAAIMQENRRQVAFGIATGRSLRSALQFLREHKLPQPDVLITSLGTDIHYAPKLQQDTAWREHVYHLWSPPTIRRILSDLPGLTLQPRTEQDRFKISYTIDPDQAPPLDEVVRLLRKSEQTVNVFQSFGRFLDIVPVRASKGAAIRYVAEQWNIPVERILAAGGSGADEDMMRGNTLAVVVANRHGEELSQLVDHERVYFTEKPHADGILEAIEHYDFFGSCTVPVG